jgi:hypothetical protein
MISVAALVLILAALNLSLGIRRFYVKILAFVFDYATKIKKDKEISIDSDIISTEQPTPQIESCILENEQIESKTENNQRISSQTDIQFKLSMNY